MTATVPLTFRIDAELKRSLDAAAAADYRSTASLLNSIIARYLAGSAHDPDKREPLSGPVREPDQSEVYYTKPKGRPKQYDPDHGPHLGNFEKWVATHPNPEFVKPEEIVSALYVTNPSPHASKMAAARQILAGSGYEALIAHYPDGSEEEIWRKTAI
jgi:hypothetical protein